MDYLLWADDWQVSVNVYRPSEVADPKAPHGCMIEINLTDPLGAWIGFLVETCEGTWIAYFRTDGMQNYVWFQIGSEIEDNAFVQRVICSVFRQVRSRKYPEIPEHVIDTILGNVIPDIPD